MDRQEENSLKWMKIILMGGGSIFVVAGLVRQWPIFGKTYLEFIEGEGYLSLILGLVMIILGFSAPLLFDQAEEEPNPQPPAEGMKR